MSGQAATPAPRVEYELSEILPDRKNKVTTFRQWLQLWEQIVVAELLLALAPRRLD